MPTKKTTTRAPKFPETLYATLENEDLPGQEWIAATETLEDIEADGTPVAIYRLWRITTEAQGGK